MRQTHRVPSGDSAKFDAFSGNGLVRNRDFLPIAFAFMRKANSNWRGARFWMAGSFSRTGMLAVLFFLFSIPITAQDLPTLRPGHISITPLVGYRTSLGLPTQGTTGSTPKLSLDSSLAYGFVVGFRIRNEDLIEFQWLRESTYARVQQANVTLPTTRATVDQFHVDFSHEYVMPHEGDRLRPYMVGSVGATNIFSGSSFSSAHISVGIGSGIKFFVSRHVGFRMQAEWLPMFISSQRPIPCGTACVVNVGGIASQAEVIFGPIIKF
jgi:hypothetical protein